MAGDGPSVDDWIGLPGCTSCHECSYLTLDSGDDDDNVAALPEMRVSREAMVAEAERRGAARERARIRRAQAKSISCLRSYRFGSKWIEVIRLAGGIERATRAPKKERKR